MRERKSWCRNDASTKVARSFLYTWRRHTQELHASTAVVLEAAHAAHSHNMRDRMTTLTVPGSKLLRSRGGQVMMGLALTAYRRTSMMCGSPEFVVPTK